MKRIAFDSDKYIKLQSAKIMERVTRFNNKLYLEFGSRTGKADGVRCL